MTDADDFVDDANNDDDGNATSAAADNDSYALVLR